MTLSVSVAALMARAVPRAALVPPRAFDPEGLARPAKVLPAASRCADLQHVPDGVSV